MATFLVWLFVLSPLSKETLQMNGLQNNYPISFYQINTQAKRSLNNSITTVFNSYSIPVVFT